MCLLLENCHRKCADCYVDSVCRDLIKALRSMVFAEQLLKSESDIEKEEGLYTAPRAFLPCESATLLVEENKL